MRLGWALRPARALPSDSASGRVKPSRSATTAAQSVSTGARLIVAVLGGPADLLAGRRARAEGRRFTGYRHPAASSGTGNLLAIP